MVTVCLGRTLQHCAVPGARWSEGGLTAFTSSGQPSMSRLVTSLPRFNHRDPGPMRLAIFAAGDEHLTLQELVSSNSLLEQFLLRHADVNQPLAGSCDGLPRMVYLRLQGTYFLETLWTVMGLSINAVPSKLPVSLLDLSIENDHQIGWVRGTAVAMDKPMT